MRRPKFSDLTPAQRLHYGNGVGAAWMPGWLRCALTWIGGLFFREACWNTHDFGYAVDGDEFDRWRCEWKFYRAMLRDAWRMGKYVYAVPPAILVATIFFLACLVMGWTAFNYRKGYASVEEIMHKEGRADG